MARSSLTRRPGVVLALLCLALAAPADARAPSRKKAIWGPLTFRGESQFPIYRDLGAGIFEYGLRWSEVATRRPIAATDPADPAYAWPIDLDQAAREAAASGMRVAVTVQRTPQWANGGRPDNWVPNRLQDFADFVKAAARRYPTIHIWLIWGEPSRAQNFMPLTHETRDRPLTAEQAQAPHSYAQMLDAAYVALKTTSRRNLVVGGNTFTVGDISPLNWIRNLRLPNGRRPRMDLYGHNPFTARRPDLRKSPLGHGFADFSDLDTLAGWLDRYLPQRGPRPLRLFLSEFLIPSDHASHEFDFHVSRATQADWLKRALRIARGWSRIYSLGWYSLYDEPRNKAGNETDFGLIDRHGRRKPSYYAFRRG
jgi:hypothetical protein